MKHNIAWRTEEDHKWKSDGPTRGTHFYDENILISGWNYLGYIGMLIDKVHGPVIRIWYNDELVWTARDKWLDSFLAIKVNDATMQYENLQIIGQQTNE